MVMTIYFILFFTTLFICAIFVLFFYLLFRKFFLNYRTRKLDAFYAKVYPVVSHYVTSGSNMPLRLVSSDVKWKRGVITTIALQISEAIDSKEELKRLNEVAKENGLINEIERMIKDKKWWVAAEGISRAGRLQQVRFIPLIKQHLDAKEFDLWHLAAKALCQMGESVHVIEYMIQNEQQMQQKVMVHLGDMLVHVAKYDETQLSYIIQQIHHVSPRLQVIFVEILGKRKAIRQLPLITSLLKHENKELRLRALRAIGDIGMTLVDEPILLLTSSPEWQERVLAIYVIQKCKIEHAVPLLVHQALQDRNWWVRVRAAQALYTFGESGRSQLVWASKFHEDHFARDIANKVLQEKNLRGF